MLLPGELTALKSRFSWYISLKVANCENSPRFRVTQMLLFSAGQPPENMWITYFLEWLIDRSMDGHMDGRMGRCTWNILSAKEREDEILVYILCSFWHQEHVVTELWNTESYKWKSGESGGQLRIDRTSAFRWTYSIWKVWQLNSLWLRHVRYSGVSMERRGFNLTWNHNRTNDSSCKLLIVKVSSTIWSRMSLKGELWELKFWESGKSR